MKNSEEFFSTFTILLLTFSISFAKVETYDFVIPHNLYGLIQV